MVDGGSKRQEEMSTHYGSHTNSNQNQNSSLREETRGSVLQRAHIGKKDEASAELVYNEHI